MRVTVYGLVSTLLTIGVILSAMHQRSNFYAVCIYLSKSSACMVILLNMGFIISVLFGKILQAVFFGRLRAIEVEHLYERSWYAVTETCLAMTIFREEFDLQFIIIFTNLLFLKIFHWLSHDRVEFMEQSPINQVSFHVRIVSLLSLLFIVDTVLANQAIKVTLIKGPNMMIMFGFEYTILICIILSIIGKYILNLIEMRSEQTWEEKSIYIFYLDLVTDFCKLVTYLVFFTYICINYQLPFHIIRDLYMTFRSFIQKCRDLYRYRRATHNMNELYPNATAEDFDRSNDSTCIICREEMHAIEPTNEEQNPQAAPNRDDNRNNLNQPKKLPCGHIFHLHCLRSWLERQQTCPTCRRSVLVQNNMNNDIQDQQQNPQIQQQQQQMQEPHHQQQNQQHSTFQQLFQQYITPQAQEQNNTVPHNHLQQPTALNILTPVNQPTLTHLNIPGLIPLVPVNQVQNSSQPFTSSSLPENLTENDLRILSTTTREAMEQRLRILETVQNQVTDTIQLLSQALSVLPSVDTVNHESVSVEPINQDQPESSSYLNSKVDDKQEDSTQQNELTERQREKLPNYTATTVMNYSDDDYSDDDFF